MIQKTNSGSILLREELNEDLLRKELEGLGLVRPIVGISNPWYYRKNNTDTWIMIGESEDMHGNFPVRWDTTVLENGQYEVKRIDARLCEAAWRGEGHRQRKYGESRCKELSCRRRIE
jgi:hypothetical protein